MAYKFVSFGLKKNFSLDVMQYGKIHYDLIPEEELPWSDIMRQLEIPISGVQEDDFENIIDAIKGKIEGASLEDLAYYEWLVDHTYRIFINYGKVKI